MAGPQCGTVAADGREADCLPVCADSKGPARFETNPEGNQDTLPKAIVPRLDRAVERLISSAIDYCKADAIAVAASAQLTKLASYHDPYDGICCVPPAQTDFDSDPPEAKPRSKWCKYCRQYAKEAIDGSGAKWTRRAARQRMRRAYKQIIAKRGPLAEKILELYRAGAIRKKFSASQIEHTLVGTFSDSEVRTGLAEIVGNHWRVPADKRFKSLGKHRYEILVPRQTDGSPVRASRPTASRFKGN